MLHRPTMGPKQVERSKWKQAAVGGASESFRSSCPNISKLPHEMAAFDIVYLVKVRGKNMNRASEQLQF